MQGIVCISGFREEELLAGAVSSVRPLGWPIVYGDGAYELALRPGEGWRGNEELARKALGLSDLFLPAPERPWASEAEKRTAVVYAARRNYPVDWALWLDCDERIEMPSGADAARAWLKEGLGNCDFARINILTGKDSGSADWKPRLLRAGKGLEFHPPRDFDVWRGTLRIVSAADGGEVTEAVSVDVPTELLRIRHDRSIKSIEAQRRAAEYVQRRREAHPGVCA